MRCAKCGYVTFDRGGECPRCGRSLPEPLVAAALRAPSASRAGRPAFLSSLMLGPIPRFYGDPGDPAVPSLLEPEEEGLAGPSPAAEAERQAVQASSSSGFDSGDEALAATAPSVGDEIEAEEEPAARPPRPARPPQRGEEPPKPLSSAPDEAEDLLASLDLEEALDLKEAPAAPSGRREGARKPEAPGAVASPDALDEAEVSPPRAAEAKGAAGLESVEDLAAFFAADAEEGTAHSEMPAGPAASQEDEDLLSLLDEADEAAPPLPPKTSPREQAPKAQAPGTSAEESMDGLLLGEPADIPAPAPAGKTAEDEDISSLWSEAFTEAAATPSQEGRPSPDAEGPAAPKSAPAKDEASDMWAAAFEDDEAAPASAKKEISPPVGASAGGGEDSLSDMWSDAFAEQEAVAKAQREGKKPQAESPDLGEGDLEKMWSDALNEAGDASPRTSPPANAALGGEDLPKEDLGGFFGEGEAGRGTALAAEEDDAAGQRNKTPGGGSMVKDEDPDEIEAYVPDEVPVAALPEEAPKPAKDFFGDADARSEEREENEGKSEIVGVPLAARAAAGGVDFGILAALQGLFAFTALGIVSKTAGPVSSNMEALILLGLLNLVVLFVLSIFYSVYFVGMFGSTPGQRCMGLSVVDMDDKPVQYMQAVLRYFGGLAATLPLGAGHLLVLFDKRSRGLGDRLAGTRVVLKVKV